MSVSIFPSIKVLIWHFRNQKETGTSLFFSAITSGTVTKDKGGTWPIVISYPDLTLFYTWEIWVRDLANSWPTRSSPLLVSNLSNWGQKCKKKKLEKNFKCSFIYSFYLSNKTSFWKPVRSIVSRGKWSARNQIRKFIKLYQVKGIF